MKLVSTILPERTIWVGTFKQEKHTLPEIEHTYAPTLVTIHNWIFGDYGPLYTSWKDGWLCPFHPQVGRKNMRCCEGRRGVRKCPGIGLLIKPEHINELSPHAQRWQRQQVGRVVCYEWCRILTYAYWDLDTNELLKLPDDPPLVATIMLRQIYRNTGWYEWAKELERRKQFRRYERKWLTPIPARG